jgi:tetratricopeptide (TPR) repeat protein
MGILQRYFSARAKKAKPEMERRERALLLSQTVAGEIAAGRFAEALAPANELIALLREASSTTSETWPWPGLGQILSDHARILRALGRPDDAIVSAREAIRIWMSLAEHDPQHLRLLAIGLSILAEALHDIGREAEAAEALRQAVRQYRGLLPNDRARLPDLAQCLSDLSVLEAALGRVEAGFAAAEEAVNLYRELHTGDVARFRPLLAHALNNLGNAAQTPEHLEAGVAAMDEAVYLFRQILLTNRDAAQPFFVATLVNRAMLLRDAGRGGEALEALQEAVAVARPLAAQSAERRSDLASALKALAEAQKDAGAPDKSLAAIQEAILVWTELAGGEASPYTTPLVRALGFAALRLVDLGQLAPAAQMAGLAVDMQRALVARDPAQRRPLAEALTTLAHVLSCGEEWERALEPAGEAAGLWCGIADADPSQAMKCAIAERVNALVLQHLEQPAEAAELLYDALERVGEDAHTWVAVDRAMVERLLADYAEVCRGADLDPDVDAMRRLEDALADG